MALGEIVTSRTGSISGLTVNVPLLPSVISFRPPCLSGSAERSVTTPRSRNRTSKLGGMSPEVYPAGQVAVGQSVSRTTSSLSRSSSAAITKSKVAEVEPPGIVTLVGTV